MNEELKQLCLEWFRNNNWITTCAPYIAPDSNNPERTDYHEVVLKRYLHEAPVRINPHLPTNAIEQSMAVILKPYYLDLKSNNLANNRLLLESMPVKYCKDDKTIHDQAHLIDFENLANNRCQEK